MDQPFKNIKGAVAAKELLHKNLLSGNVNHAYLFAGPPGVGKKTLAREWASLLVAQGDPQADIFLKDNMHPDLMWLSKADNKTVITKEQIAEQLNVWLGYTPYRAHRRVAVIAGAEFMSLEAANALLKTLEEPPDNAVIILVTDELQQMLPTIISRCQAVNFIPLSSTEVTAILQEKGVESSEAQALAALAAGNVTLAWAYAEAGANHWRERSQTLLRQLSQNKRLAIFQCAEELEEQLELFLPVLLHELRLIVWQQQQILPEHESESPEPSMEYPLIDTFKLEQALQNINFWLKATKTNVNKKALATALAWEIFDIFSPA